MTVTTTQEQIIDVFRGYVRFEDLYVNIDFSAPNTATQEQRDMAFFNAMENELQMNYLNVGTFTEEGLDLFRGYARHEEHYVSIEFSALETATQAERDMAFFKALWDKMNMDYVTLGTEVVCLPGASA